MSRILISAALVCALAAPALAANVQIPTGSRIIPLHAGISAGDTGLGFHAGSSPRAGVIGGITPAGFTGGAHAQGPAGNIPLRTGVGLSGVSAQTAGGTLVTVKGSGTP